MSWAIRRIREDSQADLLPPRLGSELLVYVQVGELFNLVGEDGAQCGELLDDEPEALVAFGSAYGRVGGPSQASVTSMSRAVGTNTA